jgi:ammonium transporter, Amt family
MVGGLATITPASGFVTIPSALVIGLVGGVVCYFAVTKLKHALQYDDSLDVFGVHGMGSTVGMLLLGFLASDQINPAIATTYEVGGTIVSLAGSLGQFVNQIKGVAFTAAFSGVMTWVLLFGIKAVMPLRVSDEEEDSGLDLTQHGESAYND